MSDDRVIRFKPLSICDSWRVLDPTDKALYRRYRGKHNYPGDGYSKDNPFKESRDRRAPRLGGC
jgi:hypothetical protein